MPNLPFENRLLRPPRLDPPLLIASLAACAAPVLLVYSAPPSSTYLNQALAFVAWAIFVGVLGFSPVLKAAAGKPTDGAWAVLVALLLIGLAGLYAGLTAALAWSLLLPTLCALAAAALVFSVAELGARSGALQPLVGHVSLALLAAGAASAVVAIVQVFAPAWTDSALIAATSIPDRAAGNLRQPNHLSSVMLWALVGLAYVSESRRWPAVLLLLLLLALVPALVLTGSRTGTLGVLLLALWAALDRQLAWRTRALLLLSPLVYALCWLALSQSAGAAAQGFDGPSFSGGGDLSSSRFAIWSNTLALIGQHPWFGVGFGEFNFAWTLTPFPDRPIFFFDHAHNLPLQLMVELGLPLATVVLALLCLGCWRALRAAGQAADPRDAAALRAAFMLVLLIAVHSLLEYPLWYAYFLLPTACALGLCLGGSALRGRPALPPSRASTALVRWVRPGAALMLAVSLYAVVDYWKVVVVFAPAPGSTSSLAERIEAGKRSLFFAHHAHYAAATIAARPSEAMDSFRVASHFLLDTRLMLAWARAHAEAGDLERARHLADRLREFRNEGSQAFLDACVQAPASGATAPFQCQPAASRMDYRAFR